MDSASRRAFPLESRTVWVEQQIKHQILLPRDNLVLGPGEYTPSIPDRHISTPVLGKYRGPADHFRNFRSSASIRSVRSQETFERNTVSRESKRHPPDTNSGKEEDDPEFVTIYHNNEKRQPTDPKTRFTVTPGPYLTHDPPLESITNEGINKSKAYEFGHHDIPFGERNPTKSALPSYDIKYDSNHVRKTIPQGSFPKNTRIYIPKKGERAYPYSDEGGGGGSGSPVEYGASYQRRSSHSSHSLQRTVSPPSSIGHLSVFEQRLALVPMPKVKTRAPPAIIFDDSSYRKKKIAPKCAQTPQAIKKEARVHLFDKIVAIPRMHKSAEFKHTAHSPFG